jgi:endonuclease V-like protein UPF0215 family
MNVIGFDDGPFARDHRGQVLLVGAVCAGTRLDGIVSGRVKRDGVDATRRMIELVEHSQFRQHVRCVLLNGIAVAGFNVVDIHALAGALDVPVLVVIRRPPDFEAIERALRKVRGAKRKWRLIQAAGEPEALDIRGSAATGLHRTRHRLWVQRAGLSSEQARRVVAATALHGQVPEPLRLAHLVAGGIVRGRSRGRV